MRSGPRGYLLITLVALACGKGSSSSTPASDEVAIVKARAIDFQALTDPSLDLTNSGVSAAAAGVVRSATSLSGTWAPKSQTCSDGTVVQGSWPDIDYCDDGSGASWSPSTHFSRLLTLAQAYRLPATVSTLHGDAGLRAKIEQVLQVTPTFYSAARCKAQVQSASMNWWFCEVGAPMSLAPALLLMDGEADGSIFASARDALAGNICPDRDWNTPPFTCNNSIKLTGENLAWVAMSRLLYALFAPAGADPKALLLSVRHSMSLSAEQAVNYGDGIQPDGSFHQHGAQVYTGGYGAAFADDITRFMSLTSGTGFALEPDALDRTIHYLADGTRWAVFGPSYDVSVISREVSRPNHSAVTALRAMLRMALIPSARQAEFQSSAGQQLAAWKSAGKGLGFVEAPLASRFQALQSSPAWPSGHRHYPDSDHTIHRRAGWFTSVKMLSTRSKSGELVNTENRLGSRQSDGRFNLLLTGKELPFDNSAPALDWARLPGITVQRRSSGAAEASYGLGKRAFVGGTGDGVNGVSAMDFQALPPASTPGATVLTAKKSWFFFDEGVVFLGADIASPADDPVETVVEQWVLSSASELLTGSDGTSKADMGWQASLNVRWLAADGVGYWFPGGQQVTAMRQTQTGDWSTIGVSSGAVSKPVLTLLLSHGTRPTAGSYAYAILPRFDAAALAGFDVAPPVTILRNDATAAVVLHQAGGTSQLGAVFWTAGAPAATGGGLSVASDVPSTVWATSEGATVTVSAADPARTGGSMTLTLPGSLQVVSADPGVTVTSGAGQTTVSGPRDGTTWRAVVH
jgi:chondroitin AC lyase